MSAGHEAELAEIECSVWENEGDDTKFECSNITSEIAKKAYEVQVHDAPSCESDLPFLSLAGLSHVTPVSDASGVTPVSHGSGPIPSTQGIMKVLSELRHT